MGFTLSLGLKGPPLKVWATAPVVPSSSVIFNSPRDTSPPKPRGALVLGLTTSFPGAHHPQAVTHLEAGAVPQAEVDVALLDKLHPAEPVNLHEGRGHPQSVIPDELLDGRQVRGPFHRVSKAVHLGSLEGVIDLQDQKIRVFPGGGDHSGYNEGLHPGSITQGLEILTKIYGSSRPGLCSIILLTLSGGAILMSFCLAR